jgi:hypothetical protein
MEVGMIEAYDSITESGLIVTTQGEKLEFLYKDGQNWTFSPGDATPALSGKHEQPEGFSLKRPDKGDPVAFNRTSDGCVKTWGYLHTYVTIAEGRYPTRFVSTSK